jgi:hypothetical protein
MAHERVVHSFLDPGTAAKATIAAMVTAMIAAMPWTVLIQSIMPADSRQLEMRAVQDATP